MSEKKKPVKKSLRVDKEVEENKPLSLADYISEESFQRVKLLSGQSISIKPWKMKEEKDFLFAVETQSQESNIEECIKLSKRCVDPKDHKVFDQLAKNDILHLLSQQRKLSKGKVVDITFRCVNPKCQDFITYPPEQQEATGRLGIANTLQEDKVNLDDNLKITAQKDEPIQVNQFTFHTRELPFSMHKALEDKYFGGEVPELNRFTYDFVRYSIIKIEIEGNEVVFDIDVLTEFLDQLSKDEYDDLANAVYENASEFSIEKEVTCSFCGNTVPIVYEELFSMLVF